MKSAAKLSTAFLAATLMAGEIDPKFLSLIPPDAKVFYGIDVERYRNSMLAEFFPVRFDLLSAGTGHAAGHQVRQVIVAAGGPENSRPPLTLLRGELFLSQLHAVDRERNGLPLYRGVPVFSTVEQEVIALLGQATAVIGDVDIVRKAIDRRRSTAGPSRRHVLKTSQRVFDSSAALTTTGFLL